MTPVPTPRRRHLLVLAGLPLLLMAPGPEGSAPLAPPAPSTPAAEARALSPVRAVELIPPGTVIDRGPPKGWTHLVLKSQPRLPDDQKRLVNDLTARLSVMVFTTTLARVDAEGQGKERRHRLTRIGLGIGSRVGGKDVILSPDTQARLGANLGLLARQVLSGVYEKQKTVRLVAAGPTSAILDTPAFMPRGRGHAAVIMRYVFLVDAATGKLDTLVWRIDLDTRGAYDGTSGFIEWLPPNKMVDAVLQVDPNEFRLGIPSEKAFAVTSIPSGQKQFSIPEGLRTVSGTARLTSEQATQLISSLRDLVREAGTPR